MSSDAERPPRGRRGRVVMLVDNGVSADSRVQKEARSAADAGWDVIVLGLSPDEQTHTWHIGRAEVRLLPVKRHLAKRPYEYRRSLLYGPLGYPPNGWGLYRMQRIKAWQADIKVRRAALTVALQEKRPRRFSPVRVIFRLRKDWLRVQGRLARILLRWSQFRYRQDKKAKLKRRDLAGLWDRFVTRFWQITMGNRAWRRLEPRLWDYELAYGPVIDRLAPDLIHANDYRMLGVGARAKIRARAAGRPVQLVWDAHEFLPGLHRGNNSYRWLPGNIAHEREYAPYADAVITVSPALADLLQQNHRLKQRPEVVLNAPETSAPPEGIDAAESASDVRTACGLDADTPLLVYSGGIAPVRGVDIMVSALPKLPGVHVALVSLPPNKPISKHVQAVLDLADRLEVRDRVHLLPYVAHWEVASFISTANAAVSPLIHLANHEIALSNKFFEYAHARLPMVVSDIRTMAETTRQVGQGEVFRAEDVDDYVRAVKAVLADPDRYRAAYDRPGLLEGWTWEAQAQVLDAVYTRLVPTSLDVPVIPDVSVILVVRNAMPYLPGCIRSLVEQSIGVNRFEVIVVDRGSTDGSYERLERFEQLYPRTFNVSREADFPGLAASYNRALTRASGRYVFFMRAEDRLGPEALERMVAAADEAGADIVVPRSVGRGQPWEPEIAFPDSADDVDIFSSPVAMALSNQKLFRRDLIDLNDLRFPEDVALGSDQPFTLEACLRAKRITVLADYDHYQYVSRRDSSEPLSPAEIDQLLKSTARIVRLVAGMVEKGPRRDAVLYRYFSAELPALFGREYLTLDRDQQVRLAREVGELADEFLTEAIAERLDVGSRLRYVLAQREQIDALIAVIEQDCGVGARPRFVLDGDVLYLRYGCFRDPALSVPDSHFVVTGAVAESMAIRHEVTGIGWAAAPGGSGALTITLHIPAPLNRLGPAPVRMTLGPVSGHVSLSADEDGSGTTVHARFLVADIVRHANLLSAPTDVRLGLDVFEGCEVPVRLGTAVSLKKRYVTRGFRPYRVKVSKNGDHLTVDVAQITARRVMGRLRYELKKGRTSSALSSAP